MGPHVGSKMLGPSCIPSRSVTPPLSESARSRRETRPPSSSSVCAPAPPRLPSEALRTLERIYTDSSDEIISEPRRWGSWYGAALASESVCSEDATPRQRLDAASPAERDTLPLTDDEDADLSIWPDSAQTDTCAADSPSAPRVNSSFASGAAAGQAGSSSFHLTRSRRNRTSNWGKTRTLESLSVGGNTNVTQQAMTEDVAWAVVEKWRRVVDVHFDSTAAAPKTRYAHLAESMDVGAMELAEQRRTAEVCGLPLDEVLALQNQRTDALCCLTQLHSRLVHKVVNHLKSRSHALGDFEDVTVEGMVLLRLCIWTYCKSHGTTFSTHAWIQLQGRMKAALYGKDRVLQMPLAELAVRRRVWAAHSKLKANLRASSNLAGLDRSSDSALVAAISDQTNVGVDDVVRVLNHDYVISEVSPDAFGDDSNGDGWEKVTADISYDMPADSDGEGQESGEDDPELLSMLDVPELRGAVDDVLNRIPLLHADVLACRYGLRGQERLNYKATAEHLGFQHTSLVNYHQQKAVKSFLNMMSYMHKGHSSYA